MDPGIKLARIRRCHTCPFRRTAHASVWRWPHCTHGGGDRELSDAYMGGPEANCPAGFWSALEPAEHNAPCRQAAQDRAACLFARESRICAQKVECRRHDGIVGLMPRSACGNCPERIERLKISAVITAHNEGDEVRRTVESLAASVRYADLEILLVDDGSRDGCCAGLAADGARLVLLRHDEPWGVGRSRNHGVRVASGDVVTFHDAHMRFPVGGLETLALKALASGAVVCSGGAGIEHTKPQWWGCDLFWNARDGLQPKWRMAPPQEAWGRVPCPMGAGYVISRTTADALAAATGHLWDDVAGRWGFSEQALAVKAFLLDVPVLVSRDVQIGHLYRESNPIPDATREVWRNICRAAAVIFPEHVFDERFGPCCERRLGAEEARRIAGEARRNRPDPAWAREPEEVFTHLCGRDSRITEPHPDNAWLGEVRRAAEALKARKPDGDGLRVLQWRPGEATPLVRRLLPHAEMRAIECSEHRMQNWRALCSRLDVALDPVPLADDAYVRPAEAGEFDLVLVGGERQEECLAAAGSILAPGGRIIAHPSADRDLIEHAEVKKEQERLDEFARTRAALAPSAPAEPPVVTVVLLNWRRAENIGPVLDALAAQTVPLQVFVWNNGAPLTFSADGGATQRPIAEHPLVSLAVQSARNMGCWPRWLLASMADTEFVCTMDDDLSPADERVLEDAVTACREQCPDGVVGFFGWRQIDGRPYADGSQHVNGSAEGRWVDFIKGRFMLFRRDLLRRVPLAHPAITDVRHELTRADDLFVSLCISRGRRGAHLVPGVLGRRWRNLPQHGAAVSAQPGHYAERGRLIQRMFDFYEEQAR